MHTPQISSLCWGEDTKSKFYLISIITRYALIVGSFDHIWLDEFWGLWGRRRLWGQTCKIQVWNFSYLFDQTLKSRIVSGSSLEEDKKAAPKPSDINEKDWSTKANPFLTSHLWYKSMLKVWRKSWEPFRIYQLTSTANPVIICEIGLDWLCYLADRC